MVVTLHASSFAGFIGKHPYNKQHEVFEKTWCRASPETYAEALKRNNRLTEQQELELLRAKNPEVDVTLHAAETTVSTSAASVALNKNTLTEEIEGTLTPHEKKLVTEEIRKQLFTRYGTAQETSVLDILVEEMGMNLKPGNDVAYTRVFETATGTPWKLVGKIDALTDTNTVVEVKNRVNRLFMRPTEYEKIQVECYLRLVGSEKALLVESLTSEGMGRTLNIIPLDRNDEVWAEWCRCADNIVDYLQRLIDDSTLQDVYFQSKKPSALLRHLTRTSVPS